MGAARGWGRGKESALVSVRVSVGDDQKLLERDGGKGCTLGRTAPNATTLRTLKWFKW